MLNHKQNYVIFNGNLIVIWDLGIYSFLLVKNAKSQCFATSAAVNPTIVSLITSIFARLFGAVSQKSQWPTLHGLTPTGVLESTVEGALGLEAPNRWIYVCR